MGIQIEIYLFQLFKWPGSVFLAEEQIALPILAVIIKQQ